MTFVPRHFDVRIMDMGVLHFKEKINHFISKTIYDSINRLRYIFEVNVLYLVMMCMIHNVYNLWPDRNLT